MKKNWSCLVAVLLAVFSISPLTHAATTWSTQEYDLFVGDFNGDGKDDILYIAKNAASASGIVLSDSSGGPNTPLQSWPSNYLGITWSTTLYSVYVADFNGDGHADILLQANTPNGTSYLLFSNTQGQITAVSPPIAANTAGLIWSSDQHHIVVGDFNGDGRADVFLQATSTSGTNAVILADGNGQFTATTPAQQWGNSNWGLNWSTANAVVYAGDFNGAQLGNHPIFDLLVQAKPIWVMIDYDVPFPVPGFRPNMNGVVLSQGSALFQSTGEQTWSQNAFGVNWSPLVSNIIVGRFNTSACALCSSVIVQGKSGTGSTDLLIGNASGTVFSTGTTLSSTEALSANQYHLLAGNFGGGSSTGLYLQSVTSEGTNLFADNVAASNVIGTAHNTYALTNPTISAPSASVVGRSPGQFAVTPTTGSATYTIPIWAPPGPKGLQPTVALTYDSSGGNGYLGMGWGLAGLSSISRCNHTVAQDGATAPVTLTTSDAYCLDGKRLRTTTGFSPYCSGGSTYQTEIADFSNVTACGTAGNGPAYFVVQSRDGRISQYGVGGNSQVLASGTSTAISWMISQVADRGGNTMAISYQLANQNTNLQGMTVPTAISWTPTGQGASTYSYSMQFKYTTIPIPHTTGYVAGTPVQNAYLLSNIQVQDGGSNVKNYVMGYTPSSTTGRETLTSVAECADVAAQTCLAPTTMSYPGGQVGLAGGVTLPNDTAAGFLLMRGDFNGDGIEDFAYYCTMCGAASGTSSYAIVLGTPSGYGNSFIATGIAADTANCVAGDLDASAEDGLLCFLGPATGWKYYKMNGQAVSAGTPVNGINPGGTNQFPFMSVVLADVNGDGLPDLVTLTSAELYVQLNTTQNGQVSFGNPIAVLSRSSLSSGSDPGFVGLFKDPLDYYGSGQQDVVLVYQQDALSSTNPTSTVVLHWTGSTFSESPDLSPAGVNAIGDLNDDGCQDIVFSDSVLQSACNGNAAAWFQFNSGEHALGLIHWDGSGRESIIAADPTDQKLAIYTVSGSTLTRVVSQIPLPQTSSYIFMTLPNATGDGLDGLMGIAAGPVQYYVHNGSGEKADLLTTITDGYGNRTTLTYTPIAQGAYTNSHDATYPYESYLVPRHVVSSATFSDPSNPSELYYQDYSYTGGWLNLQGRGFSGFQSDRQYDSRNSLWRTQTFERDFPYTGLLIRDETDVDPGSEPVISVANAINNSSACPLLTLDGTTNNQRYYPFVCGTTTQIYEYGGAEDGQLITTIGTTYAYDNWGNTTTQSTATLDKDPSSPYNSPSSPYYNQPWTSTTSTTVTPDTTGNWCLNLPTEVQVTKQAPTTAAVTRTTSYNPDYAHCRATSKTTEPSSSNYKITESYGFDGFGNISSTAVSSPYTNQCPSNAPCTTQVNWGATGQRPVSITNALNQTTWLNYDFRYGLLSSRSDPNGLTTFYQYDAFGRKAQEDRPDGTYATWSYNDCVNAGGCPLASHTLALARTVHNADGSVQTDSTTYFDQLERQLVSQDRLLTPGAYARREIRYDSFGRIARAYMPCNWTSATSACSYFASNTFDALGRLTETSRPISSANPALQNTLISSQGRTTTVTDPYLKKSKKITTVVGTMGQSIDADNYSQSFTYDGFNSLVAVSDSLGNSLFSAGYGYGVGVFQTSVTDMDLGSRTMTVDALGEVTAYSDLNGNSFALKYDALSRMTDRYEPDLYTHWTWGTSATADEINRLNSVCTGVGSSPTTCTGSGGYQESYLYDWAGRLVTRQLAADTRYTVGYSYDPNSGFLSSLQYPASTGNSSLQVNYGYGNGQLQTLSDASSGTVYWTANSQDPWHNITQETLGNGVVVNRAYDAVTSWPSTIEAGVGGGTGLANLGYSFDEMGNLQQRQNNALGLSENFYYDDLYRLDHSTLTTGGGASLNLQMHYDAMGDITSRSDINGGATWSYDANRKHAVVSAGSGLSYAYDNNGNMTNRAGYSVHWTSYNFPTQINGNGESVQFSYDHNRMRWQQSYNSSAGTETTYYIGGLLEKTILANGNTDYRHYIYAGQEPVAVVSRLSTGTNTVHYTLLDELGGTASLVDSTGNDTVNESFAAYGTQRNPATWSGVASSSDLATIAGVTRHGFTFQSMIGSPTFGLIHMNGRVEDALIGRFLSPDPYVQDPGSTQSFNRYTYVNNNPLSLIDPTGFDGCYLDWTGGNDSPPATFFDISPTVTCGSDSGSQASPSSGGLPGSGSSGASKGASPTAPPRRAPPARWAPGPPVAQTDITQLDPNQTPQGNQAHHYGSATPATCTPSDAFGALKAPGVSAPGAPAAQENVSPPIDLWHIFTPNQIVQVVSTPDMTLVNIALPGHVFQGTVTTKVTAFGTGSLITTSGAGVAGESQFMGVANDIFGALWFGLRNEMISDGCDAMNGIPTNQ